MEEVPDEDIRDYEEVETQVHEIDEESKEIEKAILEQLKLEPKMDTETWDTRKSSPLCNEPHYRAYLTHLLPQIISLDGIDIDPVLKWYVNAYFEDGARKGKNYL